MVRKPRVVLFEDDQSIRELLEMLLKTKGCEVFTYEDPSLCALQRSHDCQCGKNELCADIIITDIDMPVVSGLDFIDSQQRKGCNIRNIAVMSGAWSDADMKRARDIGCAVLQKPFSLSELEEWLDMCLEGVGQNNLSSWFLKEDLLPLNSSEKPCENGSPRPMLQE